MAPEQYGAHRNRLLIPGAVAVAAAAGMAGDLVFGVLHGKWAVAGWTASALLAGGLAFAVQRHGTREGERSAPEARSAAHQLPARRDVIGRTVLSQALQQELAQVQQPRGSLHPARSVQGRATVVVVHGAAGIGKTTLALHTAHEVAASYPDAQLYIDLRGDGDTPRTSSQALEWFLRSLGVASAEIPRSVGDRAALFRSRTNALRISCSWTTRTRQSRSCRSSRQAPAAPCSSPAGGPCRSATPPAAA
ncbi:hypothetical protein AB0B01_00580 [Streptomyces sp. NPDC044571]|uniref:hypothetical protein n=1 Tax=Streptomyces sp. NPDC044571 TaxID=3155371 RepID=UPI0033CBAE38